MADEKTTAELMREVLPEDECETPEGVECCALLRERAWPALERVVEAAEVNAVEGHGGHCDLMRDDNWGEASVRCTCGSDNRIRLARTALAALVEALK